MNLTRGIEEAACLYFKKGIEELNKKEMVSLMVMFHNPVLYNPLKRKEILEQKVEGILNKNP